MGAIISGFPVKPAIRTSTKGKEFITFALPSSTEGQSGTQADRKTFWVNVSFFPGIVMEQTYDGDGKKVLVNGWKKREDLTTPEEMLAAIEGSLIELRDIHIENTPYIKKNHTGQITEENLKQAVGINSNAMCGMVLILRPASHFNRDGSKNGNQSESQSSGGHPPVDDMDDDIPF